MLQVFSFNIYTLLDLNVTLTFVTPFVAMNFDVLSDVLNEPFWLLSLWVTKLLLKVSLGVFPYYGPIELLWWIW